MQAHSKHTLRVYFHVPFNTCANHAHTPHTNLHYGKCTTQRLANHRQWRSAQSLSQWHALVTLADTCLCWPRRHEQEHECRTHVRTHLPSPPPPPSCQLTPPLHPYSYTLPARRTKGGDWVCPCCNPGYDGGMSKPSYISSGDRYKQVKTNEAFFSRGAGYFKVRGPRATIISHTHKRGLTQATPTQTVGRGAQEGVSLRGSSHTRG